MYDNIGSKIKVLAKVLFILEAIGVVGWGLSIIGDSFFAGIMTILLGGVVAWISTWLLYGFGELIEKVTEIEVNTRNKNESNMNLLKNPVISRAWSVEEKSTLATSSVRSTEERKVEHTWRCPGCGKMISTSPCPNCGER